MLNKTENKKTKPYHHVTRHFTRRHANVIMISVLAFGVTVFLAKGATEAKSSWTLRSEVGEQRTKPILQISNLDFGNLTYSQVDQRLDQLDHSLQKARYRLSYGDKHWDIPVSSLDPELDRDATRQAIFLSNNQASPTVVPVVRFDSVGCVNELNKILIPTQSPRDAYPTLDDQFHIVPEATGYKFDPDTNCELMFSRLKNGTRQGQVFVDRLKPGVTAARYANIVPYVNRIVAAPLRLHYPEGVVVVTPRQLYDMLNIFYDSGQGAQVAWDSSKVQAFVSTVARQTNREEPYPALGTCDWLISPGGRRLNLPTTLALLTGFGENSPRDLKLKFDKIPANVGHRSLAPNTSGTVYLTYDDGLTYGDHIMDMAACYGAKVTFFEVGSRALSDTAALKRAVAEGHAVQSHGYYHEATNYASGHSDSWQFGDIRDSIATITGITGIRPTYFRPPGGNNNSYTYKAAAANHVAFVLWTNSSTDTATEASPGWVCEGVLKDLKPNDVVLLHSTLQSTSEATGCIMQGISDRGYAMQALR